MATARALSMPDILYHICDFLDDSSLSRMCRTTRCFFPPATSRLWRMVGGSALDVLLREVGFPDEGDGNESPEAIESRQARFNIYARLARELHFWTTDTSTEGLSFKGFRELPTAHLLKSPADKTITKLNLLSTPHSPSDPFANLQSISWKSVQPQHLTALSPLLSHGLRELHIHFTTADRNEPSADAARTWRSSFDALSDAIASRASAIRRLAVSNSTEISPDLYEARLCRLLSQLPELERLGLGFFPRPTLLQSAEIHPNLSGLSVDMRNFPMTPQEGDIARSGQRYNTIHSLHSNHTLFSEGQALAVVFPSLRELYDLTASATDELGVGDVTQFLTVLASMKDLERFDVFISDHLRLEEAERPNTHDPQALELASFRLLTRCAHLRHFQYRMSTRSLRLTLGPADFDWIGRAWPLLEHFQLNIPESCWKSWSKTGECDSIPVVTLRDIRVLAEHCPKLAYVEVPRLCASELPDPSSLLTFSQPLQLVFATATPFTNPEMLGCFLVGQWPNITLTPPSSQQEEWTPVIAAVERTRNPRAANTMPFLLATPGSEQVESFSKELLFQSEYEVM